MSVEPFFWPRIPMGSWTNVIIVDDDDVNADTSLAIRIGIHLGCAGEMHRMALKTDGRVESSRSDVIVACDGCQAKIVIPRKVRTYGELCAFLFDLSGYSEPED